MFKFVALLAVGMFLALLIGGEDKGQVRQGLIGADPIVRPVVREIAAAPAPKAGSPDVTLANFTPVTVQQTQSAPIAGAFVLMDVDKSAVAEVVATAAETEAMPVMYVSSNSVNVRGGPSTDYEVVGRLTRAEAVTVVSAEADGWVQIRIEGDGIDGFVAARLLTATDPAN